MRQWYLIFGEMGKRRYDEPDVSIVGVLVLYFALCVLCEIGVGLIALFGVVIPPRVIPVRRIALAGSMSTTSSSSGIAFGSFARGIISGK